MSTITSIDHITDTYQFVSSVINLTVGLLSNFAIIVIFTTVRAFRGNQSAFYLVAESFADIGLLLAYYPSNIVSYIQGRNLAHVYVFWCKIQLTFGYGFGLCSLYTICFIAFDQYLSTNHRFNWRQKSSIKLAHRLIILIITVAVIHSLLFAVYANTGILGCTIYQPNIILYFSFFYYPILSSFLPLLISVTFSLLAYRNVRRIVRRQLAVVRRRLDQQMTALALSRVLCIVILGLPFIVINLYQLNLSSTTDDLRHLAITQLISAIAYSLLYTNYCVSSLRCKMWSKPSNSMHILYRSTSISS